jgi:hypothetical protein
MASGADHIELQYLGELVQVDVDKQVEQGAAGIVNQPIDAPVPVERGLHQPFAGGRIGDVGRHRERSLELLAQLGQPVCPPRRQHRMRAGFVQQPSGCLPDTRGRTGDDDGLAGQLDDLHRCILHGSVCRRQG